MFPLRHLLCVLLVIGVMVPTCTSVLKEPSIRIREESMKTQLASYAQQASIVNLHLSLAHRVLLGITALKALLGHLRV